MRSRSFPLTDMPWLLMLVLVAIGLPRTVLADLDIVAPESSLLYYVLALAPFAAWLAVAVLRPTRRPVPDFLVLGVLYGLSLVLAHQLLWHAPGAEHSIPQGAIDFARGFAPAGQELALRGYTAVVSLGIGIGTGLVAAVAAVIARTVRNARHRHLTRVTVPATSAEGEH
ncbi:hypothetical protein H7X46_15505 [Pseudonocardia sp. C8]|uniref:hypothetical protein n=1 Tax=Pseudonocardia sp. C8 TaxID=2762759 RepID=UPI001642A87C|nr:hypothetical protein [Pseudonocardia sp. C8]MBC3192471.1 hypothetical protein [Pseudonocardia sp. C8]